MKKINVVGDISPNNPHDWTRVIRGGATMSGGKTTQIPYGGS